VNDVRSGPVVARSSATATWLRRERPAQYKTRSLLLRLLGVRLAAEPLGVELPRLRGLDVPHELRAEGAEPRLGVQVVEESVQTIVDLSRMNLQFLESCTPGYYNNEGRPAARSARDGFYGAGSPAFIRVLESWRARGDLDGLELS
jgi:hypothetical protein